ncbi:AIPR protein [Dysgonomonas alginatilytica]|uniref:AIPR protein n=1 Tax=Dysgonomonas alginatilytica TaxID=1605892 RepID=A0A2V3PRH1_9BACT|nr:AIPR family protein [Dysgonomonas alginatilytica]PXV66920.1 AIPR protein [Dysgonomonas alginatilytica]
MNIKEFADDFLENVFVNIEAGDSNQEDELTKDIIEYIKDCGEVFEPIICHYKQRGIKINAYDYNEESNTLDLFVTILKSGTGLQKTSDHDIEDAFKKICEFYKMAVSDKLISKIDESNEDAYELAQLIDEIKNQHQHVRFFVLTNGTVSSDILPECITDSRVSFEYNLWDMDRIYQQYSVRAGKEKIEIDFPTDYNHKLKCLKMDEVSDKVNVYLVIIPGIILAKIYGTYHQGLLEKNVRTFLQFKVKVNRGIKKTISEEPDMFLAYNNGISTIADSVEIESENNIAYITKINGWQIVNGGQTTASIYSTSLDKKIDLSNVFVQMKLSVIKETVNSNKIIPSISKYANSQTVVKDSDLSSNDEYHVKLETFSRKEWIPAQTGGKATSKWFYERTRGQYLDDQSQKNGAELKRFRIEYPSQNKFNKTDLAKYEMSWMQKPYDVSKGGEKIFKLFDDIIKNSNIEVDEIYYHHTIARAILFKEIDKHVNRKKLGGYKANMVSYIISLLSYKTQKKLDLDKIWEKQMLSENLFKIIDEIIPYVWEKINTPEKKGMNIGEWCKKIDCWNSITEKYFEIKGLEYEIKKESDDINENSQEYTLAEKKLVDDMSGVSPIIWFSISKWAKENNLMSPLDRKAAYNFGTATNRNLQLSFKQAKFAAKILRQAKELGFKDWSEK